MGGDEVAKTYNVTGIPTFYVVGVDGTILFTGSGFGGGEGEKLERVIEGHLKEQADKAGGGGGGGK